MRKIYLWLQGLFCRFHPLQQPPMLFSHSTSVHDFASLPPFPSSSLPLLMGMCQNAPLDTSKVV